MKTKAYLRKATPDGPPRYAVCRQGKWKKFHIMHDEEADANAEAVRLSAEHQSVFMVIEIKSVAIPIKEKTNGKEDKHREAEEVAKL